MEKTPKDNEKEVGITPSTALLNRRLGTSPAPRMLTPYEIELLRQSAKEVAQVAREVFVTQKKHRATD